jgi:hypothetical protein
MRGGYLPAGHAKARTIGAGGMSPGRMPRGGCLVQTPNRVTGSRRGPPLACGGSDGLSWWSDHPDTRREFTLHGHEEQVTALRGVLIPSLKRDLVELGMVSPCRRHRPAGADPLLGRLPPASLKDRLQTRCAGSSCRWRREQVEFGRTR